MNASQEQLNSQKTQIPKIKDSVNLGLVGGLLGTLALDFSNLLFWKKNKSETLYGQLAGSIFMKNFRTKKRNNFLLGEIIHLITGLLAGIPLVYVFKKTGKDGHLYKGAAYGSLIWMVYYVLGIKMGMFHSQPKYNKTHSSSLWQNLLYGIITAQSIVYLAHPSVFPGNPSKSAQWKKQQKAANGNAWALPHYTDYETEKVIH
ncbi:MAG: hypothetical protein GX434_05760 [Peptococcaceae bacterium]|nr:hypothetical protein [Peptococcaceae bacterium]